MFIHALGDQTAIPSLASRVAGSFAGLALGDALGMPVEMMTRAQIRAKYGRVYGFVDPPAGSHADQLGLRVGNTTDNTQLTRAVALAMLDSQSFDPRQISYRHVQALEESTAGWGNTTVRAVESMQQRLQTGLDVYKPVPRRFSPKNKGCGNGVVMKVAPVVIWQFLNNEDKADGDVPDRWLLRNVYKLGSLTHSDPRASIGAAAVAKLMYLLLTDQQEFLQAEDLLREIDLFVQAAEIDAGVIGTDDLSHQFPKMFSLLRCKNLRARRVSESLGNASFVVESAPFSIMTALRHLNDFRSGVLEAVNAGGDTDSNAAVVGAIIGANVGLEGIPNEWLNFQPIFLEMAKLGLEFYTTFIK